ncbi:MFS transporter [Limnohabitans radicicola]|uniref:MFS transporter n=1 Tax=Limnohabitans radicicola TaxID=2771427 RepID=A0A927FKQ4_9BURK|nr:MFS transporter [Limnohabitans radicicola]MBD8051867.1 MFS transporter [Limnohabitans radicicola]
MTPPAAPAHLIDSRYAAWRLLVTLGLMTLGGSCMYVVAVVLPAVQAEFGVSRADASMPYTAMMLGFGLGGIFMGRLADRAGVHRTALMGGVFIGLGFILAGLSTNIWWFAAAHALLLGLLGSSSTFGPLVADTSLWWDKRRGIAVAVCASGNYVAGTIWPALAQRGVETHGWRSTYIALGVVCGVGMVLLSFLMRQRPPRVAMPAAGSAQALQSQRPFGLSLGKAQTLLCVAGLACCVAMAMPQVHIVAYCTDLGFGAARGAEMLSLMLACGIVSRLISGAICDRIGGLRTLLMGSILQGVALLLFLPFDGLVSLYVISALFGLFQGGLVPSYAIIVREHFPVAEVGARVGAIIMATLVGMALGGWMSGKVFDLTGSYHAAFINGVLWNALNLGIAVWLLWRARRLSHRA